MGQGMEDEALKAHLTANLALLERVIAEMFYKAADFLPAEARGRMINPLALSLDPKRWEQEGLFLDEPLPPLSPELAVDLNKIWFEPGPPAGAMRNGHPSDGSLDRAARAEEFEGAVITPITATEVGEPVRAY